MHMSTRVTNCDLVIVDLPKDDLANICLSLALSLPSRVQDCHDFRPENVYNPGCIVSSGWKRPPNKTFNPLTVQDGLTDRHDCTGPADQHGKRAAFHLQLLIPYIMCYGQQSIFLSSASLLTPTSKDFDQIPDIHYTLDHVQGRLRSRETGLVVPCRPPVDVVYRSIEGVRGPERRMKLASWHAVGPQEDVGKVPAYQGQRKEKPDDDDAIWGVYVAPNWFCRDWRGVVRRGSCCS